MRRRQGMRQSGFILLASMAFLVSILTFTTVSLSRSLVEHTAAQYYIAKLQAFHLAEAGLDEALVALPQGNFPEAQWPRVNQDELDDPDHAQCETLGWNCARRCVPETACEGHVLVRTGWKILVGGVGSDLITVRASGRAKGVGDNLVLEAVAERLPLQMFPWALAALEANPMNANPVKTGIWFGGSDTIVDSYDSRKGAYGPGNSSNPLDSSTWNAAIATNDSSTDAVGVDVPSGTVGRQAIKFPGYPCTTCGIWGHVTVGVGLANPTAAVNPIGPFYDPQGLPTTSSSAITTPPVAIPPGTVGPGMGPVSTCSSGPFKTGNQELTMSVDQFKANFSYIDLQSGCHLILTGSGELHVDKVNLVGTSNPAVHTQLTVTGSQVDLVIHRGAGGSLTVGTNGIIDLGSATKVNAYVIEQNIAVSTNARINAAGKPTQLTLYATPLPGTLNPTINVFPGSTVSAGIYAPTHSFQLGGASSIHGPTEFYGAATVRQIIVGKYPNGWVAGDTIRMHYDEALSPNSGLGGIMYKTKLLAWREAGT